MHASAGIGHCVPSGPGRGGRRPFRGPSGKPTNWIAAQIRRLILEERLSPYAVAMRMKKYPDLEWSSSEKTIYNAIYAALIGVGREHLPYKPKDGKGGAAASGWRTTTRAACP